MSSYVILSNELRSYEKLSRMILEKEPHCNVMRVRDAAEAYLVAQKHDDPVCVIDIQHLPPRSPLPLKQGSEEDVRAARERLGELKLFIQMHLGDHLSLDGLARRLYITPNYLSTLFRQYENVTLGEYVETLRMQKAKDLIEEGKTELKDVGGLVGYQSISYFGRLFRKHYGISPTKYRKKIQASRQKREQVGSE